MKSISVTVATTPTLVIPPDNKWRTIYLHVVGNQPIYLGNSTVTTSTGLLTEKHTSPVEFTIPPDETIYAVVVSATEDVRVLLPDTD
jgi:hypothetical protein